MTGNMVIFLAVMAGVLGIMIGTTVQTLTDRASLVDRGLAEYCATDGRFAFKGECP